MMEDRPEGALFGPYAFFLSPEEAEAAATRFGLRLALSGGLTMRHLAPLAAFILALVFASILAVTGLVGRRAGEIAILLAAAAFMLQRLATHWRLRGAKERGKRALAGAQDECVMAFDKCGVRVQGGAASRLAYTDLEEAEDAGGLVYLWPRTGAPIVLPARAMPEDEAVRLVVETRRRILVAQGRKA